MPQFRRYFEDLHRHTDYIRYNPVKHGLVRRAADWPWSSFHRNVREWYYEIERGEAVGKDIKEMECGE